MQRLNTVVIAALLLKRKAINYTSQFGKLPSRTFRPRHRSNIRRQECSFEWLTEVDPMVHPPID
jgi:hypothetical protein